MTSSPTAPPAAAALIASHDASIEAIEAEADRTFAGDAIEAHVYIIEPGLSSERVLAAIERAAARGVEATISIDGSIGSRLSRLVERTTSLWPALEALGRRFPGRVRAIRRRVPSHEKVLVFRRRAGSPSSALFGSLNLGDRFRSWRDLLVRVEGEATVDALAASLCGDRSSEPPLSSAGAVRFVANAPAAGVFDIGLAFAALFADARFTRYRIAMAYIDRAGAALLEPALARGAAVDLVLPRRANVYHHANLLALDRLLARGGALRASFSPFMLHAKAVLATGADGAPATALLGSANLKRNSFRLFGELSAAITCPVFVAALAAELDTILAASEPARAPLRYSFLRARLEELLG